jgi:hypothetical protein
MVENIVIAAAGNTRVLPCQNINFKAGCSTHDFILHDKKSVLRICRQLLKTKQRPDAARRIDVKQHYFITRIRDDNCRTITFNNLTPFNIS